RDDRPARRGRVRPAAGAAPAAAGRPGAVRAGDRGGPRAAGAAVRAVERRVDAGPGRPAAAAARQAGARSAAAERDAGPGLSVSGADGAAGPVAVRPPPMRICRPAVAAQPAPEAPGSNGIQVCQYSDTP